jgi:hypothetical protein
MSSQTAKSAPIADEEERDDDYYPQDDADDDEMEIVVEHEPMIQLSSLQVQQVDQAFEAMFGYKWGTRFRLPSDLVDWTPPERLLCRILGPTAAASLLQTRPVGTKGNDRPHRKRQTYKGRPLTAGQNSAGIVVTKKAKAPKLLKNQNTSAAIGGVDALLQQLKGPDKVTTVAKTSADWDQFKEKAGLADKLEEQVESKNAYLKRQEFLTRVDHRQFELEKKERDRSRAKRT